MKSKVVLNALALLFAAGAMAQVSIHASVKDATSTDIKAFRLFTEICQHFYLM